MSEETKESSAPAPGDGDRFVYAPGDLVVEAPKNGGKKLIPDDDAPAPESK